MNRANRIIPSSILLVCAFLLLAQPTMTALVHSYFGSSEVSVSKIEKNDVSNGFDLFFLGSPVVVAKQNYLQQELQQTVPFPYITAQAVHAYDLTSGTVLFESNASYAMHPASVTKLMTALVARDAFYLDQMVSTRLLQQTPGSTIDFSPQETQSVKSLLKATLIQSGNDAAEILAERFPGGRVAFIDAMNEKAQKLGLQDSFFENPSGLDAPQQRMSAQNVSWLFAHALEDSFIKETLGIPQSQIFDGSGLVSRTLYNTNQLVWSQFAFAGKTGTTQMAGQVLTSLISIQGNDVVITVMNSQDRYADTIAITRWIDDTFTWIDVSETSLEVVQ